MDYQVISQCTQTLKNLETWLDKAEQHAATKGFDVGVLMPEALQQAPTYANLTVPLAALAHVLQTTTDYLNGLIDDPAPPTSDLALRLPRLRRPPAFGVRN
jgi:uncharacterized protein